MRRAKSTTIRMRGTQLGATPKREPRAFDIPELRHGLCIEHVDPDMWFNTDRDRQGREDREEAKRLCGLCVRTSDCLTYARAHAIREGIWGGLTAEERSDRGRR